MSRNRLLFLATTLLGSVLGCRQPAREPDTTGNKQSVTQVGEREAKALSTGNIDSNLAVLTQDVVIMPPNERALNGAAEVRSWLQRSLDQYTINVRYTGSDVDMSDDWAIERYTGVATITPKKGGRSMEERIKGIHIYRRQPDGSWLIAQDVWNSDSAPPGSH